MTHQLSKRLVFLVPVFATAALITAAGLYFHQDFFRILPLYVSLFVLIFSAKVNRYAFLIGGLICAIGEVIFQLVQGNLKEKTARLTVSVVLIGVTVILTGLQVFDNIAKHAGAGTLVPITGFANSVVAPAIEFKAEGFVLGLGAKMFIIAGPVLVYGITASAVYGLILYLFSLIG